MLAKVFANAIRSSNTSAMTTIVKRGAYTAGQEPKVFVNKNTRVLCQGITGKHVSPCLIRFRFFKFERGFTNYNSIGYFPYTVGYCLWHQDGRWCEQQKGRNHSP